MQSQEYGKLMVNTQKEIREMKEQLKKMTSRATIEGKNFEMLIY